MHICKTCSRAFATIQALSSHTWRSHTDKGKLHKPTRGRTAWNKGLDRSDERVASYSKMISRTTKGRARPSLTPETKLKISRKLSAYNRGGRSKWFTVSGQKVQGTWERDGAIELNRRNISWIAHPGQFQYILEGKTKTYTPDFYLPAENLYLEFKGFWWGNDRAKMDAVKQQHPSLKIVVLEKADFKRFMEGELVW